MGEWIMGAVETYALSMIMALAVLFSAAFFISDAQKSGQQPNQMQLATLNLTTQYASNMENQTSQIKNSLANANNPGGLGAIDALNLLLQGGAAAATSVIGFLGIGIAMIYDMGTSVGIPAFFLSLGVIGLIIVIIFQVIEALRLGRL